jgi:hypothetical protein
MEHKVLQKHVAYLFIVMIKNKKRPNKTKTKRRENGHRRMK